MGFEPTLPIFERQNSINDFDGGPFARCKREGHETDYSAASKVEVMNEYSYTTTSHTSS
jgi:hypothetical protein